MKFTIHTYNSLSDLEKSNFLKKLENGYTIELLSDDEIGKSVNASAHTIGTIRRINNIFRNKEQQKKYCEKRCFEKYGVTSTNQLQSKKEKVKQTNLARYGVENPYQSKEIMQNAYRKKLGVDNPWQSEKIKDKIKQTKLEKYGDENYNNKEKIRDTQFKNQGCYGFNNEKQRQTMIDKYGVDSIFKDRDYIEESYFKKLGVNNPWKSKVVQDKIKQQNIEKYGVEYSWQREDVKEKSKQTSLNKYGYDHYSKTDEYKEQSRQRNMQNRINAVKTGLNAHISDEALKIVSTKNTFVDYLQSLDKDNRTIVNIAKDLGYSESRIGYFIKLYDCKELIKSMKYSSHFENEIIDMLNIDKDCIYKSDRNVIYPYEIDVYIPLYNLGIEFNGNYWHSDIYKENDYHQQKSLKAQEKGIFIYHIFEYEWNDERKRPIIESQLLNLCHKNKQKIYARKCEIREIKDNKLIREFLDKNHLQGYRQSKIKLGLFYNNELVSIMTFGKPYLNKSDKYEWELYRFCNKLNTSVVGAFGKLFKYFIRNYNPKNVLTYSDFAKGDGHTYEKLGFKKLELTIPNYMWCNNNKDLSRYQTQMKNENIIMRDNNYYKIYDCGNNKYVWNKL